MTYNLLKAIKYLDFEAVLVCRVQILELYFKYLLLLFICMNIYVHVCLCITHHVGPIVIRRASDPLKFEF